MKLTLWLLALALVTGRLAAADAEKTPRREAAPKKAAKRAFPPADGMAGLGQILTDEQRQKFREHIQTHAQALRTTQQEVAKLRRELQDAVLSGKADEAFIRQKSEAIAKLEAEVLAARMAALGKIAATLTPEQKEKINELGASSRRTRPGLGGSRRNVDALPPPREPVAPPPPDK